MSQIKPLHAFRNVQHTFWAKLTVRKGKFFREKNKTKWTFYRCESMDFDTTLEGPGRQTVDTRSTMNLAKCTSSWESAAGAAKECQY